MTVADAEADTLPVLDQLVVCDAESETLGVDESVVD